MVENAKEAGKFAEEVEDTGGVYFVTVSCAAARGLLGAD